MAPGSVDEQVVPAVSAAASASGVHGEDASLLTAGDTTLNNGSVSENEEDGGWRWRAHRCWQDNAVIAALQREVREAKSTIRQLRERNERQQRELNEAQSVARQRRAGDINRMAVKRHNDNTVTLSMQAIIGIALFSFFLGFWFF
ncbi:hypothetical protein SYNPS1DRAFT_31970 [Syncephalis pseudoplumigaleata]|uniref:Uncharacterized protein n=1 Tax=Syncephalis pseudoplumigaleata TaxID=1712513 RepID=A0A4P9YRX3_9FUNG|nr:hypothetical protein SYNPS1DRAFT_31970 [Syncephalis pseudoplumigaleata]|eukprot:RKP22435.1 hypothetical protein SYNPS1DRAFT_31970 [Syncephalis pseudoplumigaleata]